MNLKAIFLISSIVSLAGCSSSPSASSSAAQRCATINAQFTNGTPMSQIEAKRGQPDTMIITTTLSLPPETQNQRIWVYHFGSQDILISTTGEEATPLGERGFAGAKVVRRSNE